MATKARQRPPHGASPFPPRLTDTRKKGSKGYRPAPTPAQMLASADRHIQRATKTGRPSSYTPEACDRVVALGAQGYSKASIAYALSISVETLYAWGREFPAFSEALARAHAASQHWWEVHGRDHLTADRYQAQVWHRSMAARFNEYRDLPPQVNIGLGSEMLDALTQATANRQRALEAKTKAVEPLDVVLEPLPKGVVTGRG